MTMYDSEGSHRLGHRAFSSDTEPESASVIEAEYDQLREKAREHAHERGELFHRSREAYENGDGHLAKELSNKGKEHGEKMAEYNEKASEYIFKENNAPGRVAPDTIDLHGQFVEEAEEILTKRIKQARSHHQKHLHVIVGKGEHSKNHVTKIKPAVEKLCNEIGLQWHIEHNTGRLWVDLTGSIALSSATHEGGYTSDPTVHHSSLSPTTVADTPSSAIKSSPGVGSSSEYYASSPSSAYYTTSSNGHHGSPQPANAWHNTHAEHAHAVSAADEFPPLPSTHAQQPAVVPVREINEPDINEKAADDPCSKIFRKLEKACCTIM